MNQEFDAFASPFEEFDDSNSIAELEQQMGDFQNSLLPPIPNVVEDEEILPLIPDNELEVSVRVDTSDIEVSDGNFEGFEFDEEEFEEVNNDMVKPNEFSIAPTLEAKEFDDFSILSESNLTFPYLVFSARGNLKTISSLCSGILSKGDVQLYFRPETDNLNKFIPVTKVSATPINIRNLLRLAMKDSVYYRVNEESAERLAKPEQFLKHIDLGLKEDETYWNTLIEEEQTNTTPTNPFIVEDLFA